MNRQLEEDADGYKYRQERRDRIKVWLEALTFAAVVVYAGLTYCLLKAAQRQADTANESMRVSNRPYVYIAENQTHTPAEWITDSSKWLKLYLRNFGATPATEIWINGCFLYDGADTSCLKRWVPIEPARSSLREQLKKMPPVAMMTEVVPTLPSQRTDGFRVIGPNSQEIAATIAQADKGKPVSMNGTIEYINIFGEYCCKPFGLTLSARDQFVVSQSAAWLGFGRCPRGPDIHNVCEEP